VTASPTVTIVGEVVTVSVGASDPDNQTLTYTYDYGDGTTDNTGMHTYSVPGDYTITVKVSDGEAVTQTASVTIKPGTVPLKLIRLKGGLNVKGSAVDIVRVTADLLNAADLNIANQDLTVDVGGAVETFKLNSKGIARKTLKDDGGSISRNAKKKDGSRRLFISMLGNWSPQWQDEKIRGNAQGFTIMPLKISIGGKVFAADVKVYLSSNPHSIWVFDSRFNR